MRLGIYAFFDADGVADAGDLMYLDAVAAELDRLVIVVNGTLAPETRRVFERYTDTIFCRENHGFDAGAFRDVLLARLPQEMWREADELVLFNNTVFGPVHPLGPLFERFSASPVDFWGMTLSRTDELPDHLQSYFLVFKHSVLQSTAFLSFWQGLRMDFTNVDYLIATYEIRLTGYLRQHGFSCATVVSCNYDIYVNPDTCLADGLPILKKKTFRTPLCRRLEAFESVFARLKQENPALLEAIRAYMERHAFDWQNVRESGGGHLCWTNEAILAAVAPYASVYFYGLTVRSYYLMSLLPEKKGCFVESDAYFHGPKQGEFRVLRLSEVTEVNGRGEDAVMVVFLRKHNADLVRGCLEQIFAHVIYLCDSAPSAMKTAEI